MVTVYTPGGILHTNNYQVFTIFSFCAHFDMMCIICRKVPGELCCLREPSQNTNLSNKAINLGSILHFPLERVIDNVQFVMFVQFLFLWIIIKKSSIFQSFRGR